MQNKLDKLNGHRPLSQHGCDDGSIRRTLLLLGLDPAAIAIAVRMIAVMLD